jgi:hypothetical protein
MSNINCDDCAYKIAFNDGTLRCSVWGDLINKLDKDIIKDCQFKELRENGMTESIVLSMLAYGYPVHSVVADEAMKIIKAVLEKQVGKKINTKTREWNERYGNAYLCPNCKEYVFLDEYCSKCGQKLEV